MFRIILPGLFLLLSAEIWPQTPMVVNKITGPITFDGVPDEAVWQSIPSLPMVMHVPVFGNEPTEKSIIKIGYDDEYFYITGLINYKDPANIRAVGKKRDYFLASCDWFGIILDSFNDRKNGVGS